MLSSYIRSSASSPASAMLTQVQKRFLNIHEYQAKMLMQRFGVDHQRGFVVSDVASIKAAAERAQKEFGTQNLIVKSQILAGGRGKGTFDTGFKGGVKFCTSADKAVEHGTQMLGNRLTTVQTPPGGIKVQKLFVAECLDFKREMYFAILLDRASGGAVIMASTEGGVEIEEVAAHRPEAIVRVVVKNLDEGPSQQQIDQIAASLKIEDPKQKETFGGMVKQLFAMFCASDSTLLEVNPLVETTDGRIVCIDGKINIDDNAAFRQAELFSWRDWDEEDPREVEAAKSELNYVGLDGNIGCMVNGAGLAMATMDALYLNGGKPANFLDVGGGAQKNQIVAAFKLLQGDPKVQSILVNIFGGIMRCDIIADGIVQAAKEIGLRVPLVVRLSGTNSDIGAKILQESGINCITAQNLDEAAKSAVSVTSTAPKRE